MTDHAPPRLRLGLDGLTESVVLERLAARAAAGRLDGARRAAVDGYRLKVPLEQDEDDEEIFEAYRRLARDWNVAEAAPIVSHRRWVGPWIVRAKRFVRRAVAFEVEPALARQARFNRAVLDLIGLLLAEIGRLRGRLRDLETPPRREP